MPSEQHIQQQIRLALSRGPVRLWRNNTGAMRDDRGQLVRFGLCPGSADLIGYRSVTITPDMVGQQLAVFTAVEVKSPTGRPTAEQTAWLEHITAAGGLAGIARSIADAQRIVGSGSASAPIRCGNHSVPESERGNISASGTGATGARPSDVPRSGGVLARSQRSVGDAAGGHCGLGPG
jgi:hypothetical protein